MNKKWSHPVAACLAAGCLVLVGCGGAAATTAPPPTAPPPTPPPTNTPEPTASPTAQPTAEPLPTENAVRFQNEGERRLNVAEFDLRLLDPAPEGLAYFAWLVTDDGGTFLPLGEVQAGEITSIPDADGRNLLLFFSGAVVSLEPAGSTPTRPTLRALEGALPRPLLPQLRQLIGTASTPNGLGFEAGVKEQADISAEHGQLALDAINSNDYEGARRHSEHIINIIVGTEGDPRLSITFGDHNGDGDAENPGDGFGVWPYAREAIRLIDAIIESGDATDRMADLARNARLCLVNVQGQSEAALRHAQVVLDAGGIQAALTPVGSLQVTTAAANGVDANGDGVIEQAVGECGAAQAYQLTRDLTAIVLEPVSGE